MKDPSSPPTPPFRRRSPRSTSSSSSSTSSSPSPCPSHCNQTPLHKSASSLSTIPFSWERTPGIPKIPANKLLDSRPVPNRLPLPPLMSESFPRKKRCELKVLDEFDPFAVALVECAKDPAPSQELELWMNPRAKTDPNRFGLGMGLGLGFIQALNSYGNCKSSCSVTESTIKIPRAGQRVAAYRVLKN